MKANELRIGNLFILPNGDIGKISYHEIRLMVVAIEKPDYQPIPLTEEWLLKFGFVQSSNNLGNTFHILKKDGVIVMLTIEHWTNIDINSKYHNHWHCEYLLNGHKLQYLHQLQNLYFALTGEELTIKENEI
jgi:hypothetical protein